MLLGDRAMGGVLNWLEPGWMRLGKDPATAKPSTVVRRKTGGVKVIVACEAVGKCG